MKQLSEMTVDELNALPVFKEFGATRHKVGDDGTVTLPNGRVLHATPGHYIEIPNRQEIAGAYWVNEHTPLCWRDEDGVIWRPVKLLTGEWRKERA